MLLCYFSFSLILAEFGAETENFMRTGIPSDERNMTALQSAAEAGSTEKVLTLLQDGADHSETDRAQWTAVFHAVEQGHADVVHILLDKGANPNARNRVSATPLMLAAFYNDEAHKNVSKVLLEHSGIDVDAQEAHGWTALMHAVKFNDNYNQTKLLLDAGANPNKQDIYGMTPFMTAVERLQVKCIRMMLKRKDLDFSIQDIYGFDVHKFAAKADKPNITGLQKVLLDKAQEMHDELR